MLVLHLAVWTVIVRVLVAAYPVVEYLRSVSIGCATTKLAVTMDSGGRRWRDGVGC